jgi:hypothetical protein
MHLDEEFGKEKGSTILTLRKHDRKGGSDLKMKLGVSEDKRRKHNRTITMIN